MKIPYVCNAIFTGYLCEQHNNPADFFLDVIIENEETDGLEGTSKGIINLV